MGWGAQTAYMLSEVVSFVLRLVKNACPWLYQPCDVQTPPPNSTRLAQPWHQMTAINH